MGGGSPPRAPEGLSSRLALADAGMDDQTTAVVRRWSSGVEEDEGIGVAWTASGGVEEDVGIRRRTVAWGTARQCWWWHGGVEQCGMEDRGARHSVRWLPR